MRSLSDLWQWYLDEVIPPDADPIQIQETRRAFYAGARAFKQVFDSDGDGWDAYYRLERELKDFLRSVAKGEA